MHLHCRRLAHQRPIMTHYVYHRVHWLLGEEASPSIGNTLWRVSEMFTRSAITPPEVNGFGWNLGNSEYIVWSGPDRFWARSMQKRERKFCFCQVNNARLCRFPVSQISRNLHTRRGTEKRWIPSDFFFENLPLFQKTLIIVNDFRLQAAISPKWLQILESDDRFARLWNVGFPSVPL